MSELKTRTYRLVIMREGRPVHSYEQNIVSSLSDGEAEIKALEAIGQHLIKAARARLKLLAAA